MSGHHSFGYSLHETPAERRVRLGGYDPHPGYRVPYRERLALPGMEWLNFWRAMTVVVTLIRKQAQHG